MALPWVRLDSHIASHDKILALLSDPSPKRWQAAFSYPCAIGWAGGQGTDGAIPRYALSQVHATEATARLLVKYRLWEESLTGWTIVNFNRRQPSTETTDAHADNKRRASEKGNCVRWHPEGCWDAQKGCSK